VSPQGMKMQGVGRTAMRPYCSTRVFSRESAMGGGAPPRMKIAGGL